MYLGRKVSYVGIAHQVELGKVSSWRQVYSALVLRVAALAESVAEKRVIFIGKALQSTSDNSSVSR